LVQSSIEKQQTQGKRSRGKRSAQSDRAESAVLKAIAADDQPKILGSIIY
jgi:hypothetical protein